VRPGEALRALLDQHGYGGEEALRLLGPADAELTPEQQRVLWLGRALATTTAAGHTPAEVRLAILLRLFLLMEPVSKREVKRHLGRAELATLRALGLLSERERDATQVGTLQISLHRGLRIVSDRDPLPGRRGRADVVFGPTSATMVLDRLTPRAPVSRALDLGSGTGYLALRLAEHAEEVVATDVSPRAVDFTVLNADLNGHPEILALRSDRFSALPGQRFGLITGNLPFVISPERRFVYRDGGDDFVASVLAEVGRHLAPDGWAFFLGQWPLVAATELEADSVLAAWLAASGCDGLVLCSEREAADRYAARWSAGPAPRDRAERDRRFQEWMAFYDAEGIAGVATGLFLLRPAVERTARLWCEECPDLAAWGGGRAQARLTELTAVPSRRRRSPHGSRPRAPRLSPKAGGSAK